MGWTDEPPATRTQCLLSASKAALKFNEACRRAFAALRDGQTRSDGAQLKERDLQNARSHPATVVFFNAVDQPEGMFLVASSLHIPGIECSQQVNAINLALLFELFMPEAIRLQHPFLTNEVPLVDPEKVNSLYIADSVEEKLQKLWYPVSTSIEVLLHLCAQQDFENTLKALQGVILDACTTIMVIGKHTLKEAIDKEQDCKTYFDSSFIENPSLASILTKTQQAKAVEVWDTARRKRINKAGSLDAPTFNWIYLLQILKLSPSETIRKYDWETLCLRIVHELARNLVQATQKRAEEEMAENTSILEQREKRAHQSSERASSSDSIASSSKAVDATIVQHKAASTRATPPRVVRRDEATERVMSESVSQDVFPLDSIPGLGDDDEALAGYGQDEGAAHEPTPERETTPLPKQTVIPKGFRFNAPQPNAVKINMTPSPPSSKPMHTWRKVKKAAPVDRTRTISSSTTKSKETLPVRAGSTERENKRKYVKESEDEEGESPRKKQRAGGDKPPELAFARNVTSTIIPRVSIASGTTLVAPTIGSGKERMRLDAANRDVPSAIKLPPKRKPVMAATSSDESEGERRKPHTRKAKPQKANDTTTPKVADIAALPTVNATTASTSKAAVPAARPTANTVASRDLGTNDVTTAAKARLAALRAQREEKERRLREFADGEADSDIEMLPEPKASKSKSKPKPKPRVKSKKSDDDDYSNTDTEAETERVEGSDSEDALHRSKDRLSELQSRAKKNVPPMERRARHLPIGSDEEEGEPQVEQGQEPKKKRGRPRKDPADKTPKPSINRYRTGHNETGRVRWTKDEDATLLFAIEALYYRKQLTRPWNMIMSQHGIHGTEDQVLANRNVQQMKDRARNIVIAKAKRREEVPEYLNWITIPAEYK
ncbi:SubName: Full=Uncharacterized protein {ECO:0000313/EMBL:CCA70411.1} [Serendipita indica DSM 11827]|nr:SubName: Full=Uncharacterized protein {ECO:0000313/EMBL:CCA70411.1} [Serendipita indica DSM 11827]